MQQAPEPIMELTQLERNRFAEGKRRRSRRATLSQAVSPLISTVREQSGIQQATPRQTNYPMDVTVPAFNAWIDRQFEKKLAEFKAKREAKLVGVEQMEALEQAEAKNA